MPPLGYRSYETRTEHDLESKKVRIAADMRVIMEDVRILDSQQRNGLKRALKPKLLSPKVYYEADLSEVIEDSGALVEAWLQQANSQTPVELHTDIVKSSKEPEYSSGGHVRARTNHLGYLELPYDTFSNLAYEG